MTVAIIRTIILYALIVFAIKMMGKRQISDLQTSELVITIMISNIAAIPMEDSSQPLLSSLVPISILICCEISISCLMLKSPKIRQLICGKPVIVIEQGKINQNALKYLRLSNEDLMEQLRQLDVFSVSDVLYAIMETNGQMSVLKKPEKQPPDASTLGIGMPETYLEAVIISDGNIFENALDFCSLNHEWLENILKKEKIKKEDVFLMTANKNKEFNIIKKEIQT